MVQRTTGHSLRSVDGLLRWLLIAAMPFLLVLTGARLVIADWYPRHEYAKPDFPADRYGFTQAQRLELALVAIHYLNSPEPAEKAISMLTGQRLPGTTQPLYSPAEISHMLDVKRLTDRLWRVQLAAALVVAASLAALVTRTSTRAGAFWAVMAGGLFTAGVLLALALFVLVGWQTFFVQFHQLFFESGTWTFDWQDSLIRLFPNMLWFDAGLLLTVGPFLAGLAVALAGYLLWRSAAPPAGE